MKFQITMKDPDGVYYAIQDAAKEAAAAVTGIDDDERETLIESKQEKIKEITEKWIEYSEYLTVEIDTEARTIAVIPLKK